MSIFFDKLRATFRLFAAGGAAVALALFVVWVIRFALFVDAELFPPHKAISSADRDHAAKLLGSLEDVSFFGAEGLRLRGWFVAPRNGATVVLVHGSEENRMWLLADAAELVAQGFGVMLYDNRASGESEGRLETQGDREADDLVGALDWLCSRPSVDCSRIGAEGFSIGAIAVAVAAARDQRIKVAVLKGVWTSAADMLSHEVGNQWIKTWMIDQIFKWSGGHLERADPLKMVSRIAPRPLLIVSGDQDTTVPSAFSHQVFDAAGQPKSWYSVVGANHTEYETIGGESLRHRVVGFFQRGLGVIAPASHSGSGGS
jgi:dipeptidyl aminopeptidase/acylaminoacyl peptidase